MEILRMQDIDFYYGKGKDTHMILQDADFSFETKKMYAILGKSGLGKSTTLALLGALEAPKKGQILLRETDIREIGYQKYRNQNVSIIFQNYNLLPYLTGYENVKMVTAITKNKVEGEKEQILSLLEQVGISEKTANQMSTHLSGGEQQRIAIARAVASESDIILADEPTGNLDEDTASDINHLFQKLAHEKGKCVIVVTHTKELAKCADVVVELSERRLKENVR